MVQVEDTRLVSSENNEEKSIEILSKSVVVGHDIREIGCDIKKDELVLSKFTELGPIEIGLCASLGIQTLPVFRMPMVGLLSMRDELVAFDTDNLRAGAIRDSNKLMLRGLLTESMPNVSMPDLGVAKDNVQSLKNKLEQGFKSCDIIISTGGVSMGDRDLMRLVLEADFDAQIVFARVNMKPGKPLAKLAYNKEPKILLGLPGNLVSAATTFQLYVRPLCRKLCGLSSIYPTLLKAKLMEDRRLDPSPEYCRVLLENDQVNDKLIAFVTGNQISSRLLSCKANGLLILPAKTEGRQEVKKGERFDCIVMKRPFQQINKLKIGCSDIYWMSR